MAYLGVGILWYSNAFNLKVGTWEDGLGMAAERTYSDSMQCGA